MRHRIGAAGPVLLLLSALGCRAEEGKAPPSYSAELFVDAPSAYGAAFSPDESDLLYSSDRAQGTLNAFVVPRAGGEPRALTASRENDIYAFSFFRRRRSILYGSREAEGQSFHLFLRRPDGRIRDLTPEALTMADFMGWSRDRKAFFYKANPREKKRFDLFEMDAQSLESKLLFRNDGDYLLGPVSDDRRFVAVHRLHSRYDSDMYVWDREARLLKHLTPQSEGIYHKPVTFGVGNHELYYLSDEGSEYNYLMRLDLKSGRRGKVEEAPWDIHLAFFSRTGKYRVVGINNNGRTELRVYEEASGRRLPLPDLPGGQMASVTVSDSERFLAFQLNAPRLPDSLYAYEFARKRLSRLTSGLPEQLDPAHLSKPEIVRFKSFDGLSIPAIHYPARRRPEAEGKPPALIFAHGGPGGQFRVRFSPLAQYLANHGFALLLVNNRGSSGYGKTFSSLDDRRHGRDDLKDLIAGKRFLAEAGCNPQRIGIIGGSYGGFLVLAALAFHPEAFAVGIDLYGVANWLSTLRSIPPWQEAARQAIYAEVGHPEEDEEYLRSISPLFHAHKIRRPLMVVQGGRDPRVKAEEKEQLVAAVKKSGTPVEYLLFPDEEHIASRRENRVKLYKSILKFLHVHLAE